MLRPFPSQRVLFKLVDWWAYAIFSCCGSLLFFVRLRSQHSEAWQSLRGSVLFTSPRSLYCGMCILACIGMEIIILAAVID